MRVRAAITITVVVLAALLGACKQGAGDVCQINDDCESPLLCNASTGECQRPGAGNEADAAPLADAAIPPDASPEDAAVDAAPDAAAPDAAAPDAAPDAGDPDADTGISELP
jgi:hypothetical protein